MARDGDGIYTRSDRPGYYVSYKDADGRRRRRKVNAANRTEANSLRSGFVSREAVAEAHGVRPPSGETFAEVAKLYLAHQRTYIGKENYAREAEIVENHLKPFFAGELRAIRRPTIQLYITERSAQAAPATVIKEFNVLKHLLKLATDLWEFIPVNPAQGVKSPKAPPGRVRYLQPEELRALLEASPSWLRPIIALAVATAMRRSEILGLRWLDIDHNGARLFIRKTKNGDPRIVYLNRLAMLAITSLQRGAPTALLFPGLDPAWVSVAFIRLCVSLNVADFHFHDLRHTAASWLRMQGADIHTVAQVLGHKDLRMTMRYSHLSPDYLSEAVGRLDGAFKLCHQYVTAQKQLAEPISVSS
jgi:integrase